MFVSGRAILIKLIAFVLMVGSLEPLFAQNKLVYCICNPRSKLIELQRCIGSRGDFKVMHIPGNWAYCHAHNFTDITKGWYRDDAPATYQEALEDIMHEVSKKNVFVGENTHTAKDFFEVNENFVYDTRLQLVFLVSDLHGAIISYYRKKQEYFDKLPASQMNDSIGLKGMYDLLMDLKRKGLTLPVIIKSEDLFFNTRTTVQSLCTFLKVPFIEQSLQWPDLSADFTTFEKWGWYTIELTDCSKKWHLDAIKSTGFTKPETFAVDDKGSPTFAEIVNPKHREICVQAYKENLVYYQLLFEKK